MRLPKITRSDLPGYLLVIYAFAVLIGSLFLSSRASLTSLTITAAPPDFTAITSVDERKQIFFDYFLPIIEAQNQHYAAQRRQLVEIDQRLRQGKPLTHRQRRMVDEVLASYPYSDQVLTVSEHLHQILLQVDVLPPSLVLAQAAMESAWGTSRFVVEGNNFFGQWCFKQGCGLLPHARRKGKNHEVAVFASAEAAVAAYFRNINSHVAYADVRRVRAELREQQLPLQGEVLAGGLHRYSEKGGAYIRDIRALIHNNNLHRYD